MQANPNPENVNKATNPENANTDPERAAEEVCLSCVLLVSWVCRARVLWVLLVQDPHPDLPSSPELDYAEGDLVTINFNMKKIFLNARVVEVSANSSAMRVKVIDQPGGVYACHTGTVVLVNNRYDEDAVKFKCVNKTRRYSLRPKTKATRPATAKDTVRALFVSCSCMCLGCVM